MSAGIYVVVDAINAIGASAVADMKVLQELSDELQRVRALGLQTAAASASAMAGGAGGGGGMGGTPGGPPGSSTTSGKTGGGETGRLGFGATTVTATGPGAYGQLNSAALLIAELRSLQRRGTGTSQMGATSSRG